MVKLTKALIKKYGISKKAWSIARQKQTTRKTIRKTKNTKRIKTMARKRRVSRRTKKSSSNNFLKGLMPIVAPIAYGFVRDPISDWVASTEVAKKLPVSNFTDEGVMLALNWGAKKVGLGKVPVISSILKHQKSIELGRIGSTLSDMRQMKSGTQQKTNMFIN